MGKRMTLEERVAMGRAAAARDLASAEQADLWVEFHGSDTLAGPCPNAAKLAGKRRKPAGAPLPPFDDCTHPEQCGCFYQARLSKRGKY